MALPTNEPIIQEDSEGSVGSTAPTIATQVGFKDQSGNLQPGRTSASGNIQTVVSEALPAGSNLLGQMEISDGTNILGTAAHPIRNDPTGTTTQPISAASLPLPTGAATSANQTNGTQQTKVTDGTNFLPTADVASRALFAKVTDGTNTQPTGDAATRKVFTQSTDGTNNQSITAAGEAKVSVTQPLPAGTNVIGALSANQSVNVAQIAGSTTATLAAGEQKVGVEGLAANGAAVSGNPVLVAGSDGTDARTIKTGADGTVAISAASLPLPTGAATSANQTNGTQQTQLTDGTTAVGVAEGGTALETTEAALAVALSPNTPLPAGTNIIGALSADQSVNVAQIAGSTTATLAAGEQKVGVEGLAASGSAVSGNPVLVAGSDGTDARNLTNRNSDAIATDYGVVVRQIRKSCYMASTNGVISTGTVANTVTSLAYLFHPSADTKRIEIERICVGWTGNGGNNGLVFEGAFITAENATPGGTSQTINALDRGDSASTCTFRTGATGAPVRATGDLISVPALGGNSSQTFQEVYVSQRAGKGITLRASTAEGFEIRSIISGTNIANAVSATVYFEWTEE